MKFFFSVIPAKAGIQFVFFELNSKIKMDSRFRGNDELWDKTR